MWYRIDALPALREENLLVSYRARSIPVPDFAGGSFSGSPKSRQARVLTRKSSITN